ESGRAEAGLAGRKGEDVLHRRETDRRPADGGVDVTGERVGELGAVDGLTLRVDLRLGLEGRDLGHVEHVEDVETVARGLDPAVAVDREVAERVRSCARNEGKGRQSR